MTRCAIVDLDTRTVTNVIDYDSVPIGVPPGMTGKIIAVADDLASPGWTWNGTSTVDPNSAQLVVPLTSVAASIMLARLTDAEYTAIIQAGQTQLAAGNDQMSRWFDMMRTSQSVGLSDQATIAAKAALVGAGLLTQARADAIFAP